MANRAQIDYKGFRIVATCVLPLGPHTLCYGTSAPTISSINSLDLTCERCLFLCGEGSNDGGKTVLARDPVFNKAMEKVGKCLNLKKHTVGRQRVPIIGPGDIEGTRPTRIRLTPATPAQILTLYTRHTLQTRHDTYDTHTTTYKRTLGYRWTLLHARLRAAHATRGTAARVPAWAAFMQQQTTKPVNSPQPW